MDAAAPTILPSEVAETGTPPPNSATMSALFRNLQPFRKGIRLRGGPWRDLPFIITLRKLRRDVLSYGNRDVKRAIRGRVDDRDAALDNDFLEHELVQPRARGQGSGRAVSQPLGHYGGR